MELQNILGIILQVVAIITLIVIIFELVSLVTKVNKVLDNINVVSNGNAEFTRHPNEIKENVSDLAGMTVDKIVGTQVDRLKANLTNNLIGGVMSSLRNRK